MKQRLAIAALITLGTAAGALAWPLSEAWFDDDRRTIVFDRHGVVLAERGTPERGRAAWVELDEVAPELVDALVAAEDRRFYSHPGIDPLAIGRAALANARAGHVVQGGSTLTQQTARLLATRPPGLGGKVFEAWWALRLDAHLSKDELLTWYLNRAYFGRGTWGIAAAARECFDESPAGLSVAEAATLVAVLPAPERLHPRVDPTAARDARDRVLDAMVSAGSLSSSEAALAKAEPIELRTPLERPLAPHLVERVIGEHPRARELHTTLDADLQRDVQDLVAEHIDELDGWQIDHAAVLVADVTDATVLAYVGSADWHAPDGQVDGIVAARSPGSTLKPMLYGIAFDEFMSPATVLPDLPRRYVTTHGSWAPDNYSRTFQGPVRAREALANSDNLPAVVTLEQVGVYTLHQRLGAIGIDMAERPEHFGLGMAIGAASASVEQLTSAYVGLANHGRWRPLTLVAGDVPEAQPFLSERTAFQVTDILSDPVARVRSFGRSGALTREYPVAVKTGTSTAFRDNWTVGFTDRYVVAVWAGNFDGRPMAQGVSGVSGAAPLWGAVMDRVTGGESRAAQPPAGLESRSFCALSGATPGPHCPHVVQDWERSERPPAPACDWHREGCDVAWPAAFAAWAQDEGLEGCEGQVDAVAIAYPPSGAVFHVDPRSPRADQQLPLRVSAPSGAKAAVWRVDGQQVASVSPMATALWTPPGPGAYRVELEVDGVPAAPVEVWIGGVQ